MIRVAGFVRVVLAKMLFRSRFTRGNRQHFRQLIPSEVARTVSTTADLEDELRNWDNEIEL